MMTINFNYKINFSPSFFLPVSICLSVSVILKERKSKDSITLSWQGPDRPNGVIVEYEVIYYEKVILSYLFATKKKKKPNPHF